METMTTWTGRVFEPLNMSKEDVCLEDIANALSMLCRGGGHVKYFFSVAQHSINCANEARERGWSPRIQLLCLLHDASEAYISDIIRPVKGHLTEYYNIEGSIMNTILEHFGLLPVTDEENRMWKQVDDDMMYFELYYLMNNNEHISLRPLSSKPDINEKPYRQVAAEFIEQVNALMEELGL